jgi:hypothetical protein
VTVLDKTKIIMNFLKWFQGISSQIVLRDKHEILKHHTTNNCVVTLNEFLDPFPSAGQDVSLRSNAMVR